MSDTCSLFPPFGDPWPSCLLPSHTDTHTYELLAEEHWISNEVGQAFSWQARRSITRIQGRPGADEWAPRTGEAGPDLSVSHDRGATTESLAGDQESWGTC